MPRSPISSGDQALLVELAARGLTPTHPDSVPDLLIALGVHGVPADRRDALVDVLARIDATTLCAVAYHLPADALWQAREVHVRQAADVATGQVSVRTETSLATVTDPAKFAVEVLALGTALAAVADPDG